MEREQQQQAAPSQQEPVHEGGEAPVKGPAPIPAGAVPAVQQEPQVGTQQTASEQAYKAGGDPKKAAADTQRVLQYIRAQAKIKAKNPGAITQDSMIYKRLNQHYLTDYLKAPSPTAGKAAVNKVGEQMDPSKADPNDYWERNSSEWNNHTVPESMKLLLPQAPAQMGAATMALSKENRKEMPYIDAPQMVGSPNTEIGENADVYGGGKNVSQLMHWATGVKYSDQDPQTMRDLFLAYENYHLEGWDKFGEDSINDMISEDAGRIMGRQLQAGEINQDNLAGKLNEGFDESRAWVGSLVKARQGELDGVITSQTVVESQMWWGQMPEQVKWWGDSTIYLDLLGGKTVEEIEKDSRTEHFIDIYSLMYYSDEWEKKKHQSIDNSNFTDSILKHKYDKVFEKSVKGEKLTPKEKMDAYLDAKAPWVPGFLRPVLQKMAGKKLGDGGDGDGDKPKH